MSDIKDTHEGETYRGESHAEKGRQYVPKPMQKGLGLLLLLVVLLGITLLIAGNPFVSGNFPPVDAGKWQAVFLSNNQVYFGRLKNINDGYAALDHIYYLRINQTLQPGSGAAAGAIDLIKLGGELHGPEDRMYIPKTNILFWENLKNDSQVVQIINQFTERARQP